MHTFDHHNTSACTTIDGMVLVSSSWARVLFNIGALHSFISILFTSMLRLEYEPLESALNEGVPLDRDCELSFQYGSVRIDIGSR